MKTHLKILNCLICSFRLLETSLCLRSVVPTRLGIRDQFHGRHFSTNQGMQGWFQDDSISQIDETWLLFIYLLIFEFAFEKYQCKTFFIFLESYSCTHISLGSSEKDL